MPNRVLLVDLSNHVHSDYHGDPARAADMFIRRIQAVQEKAAPNSVAIALDLPGPTFRHELVDDYKAGRSEPEQVLKDQLSKAVELCRENGWEVLSAPGFEADDVIATCTSIVRKFGWQVVISSTDKDCRQLLEAGAVTILRKAHSRGNGVECEWFTTNDLAEKSKLDDDDPGLTPSQFLDYQCLVGDKVDNIQGCKGIGDKTARQILRVSGTLDKAFENPWLLPIGDKLRSSLMGFQKRIDVVRQLVTLRTDVPLDWVP